MRLSLLTEDIQKTREILISQNPNLDVKIIDDVISKSIDELYVQWVVEQISKKEIIWPEDGQRLQKAYSYYLENKGNNDYLNRIREAGFTQPKNILTYGLRDIESLYPEEAEKEESQSERSKNRQIKAEGSYIFYDGPEGKIIKITSPEAMVLYAKNTKWCVSNEEVAKGYLKDGPLYMLIVDGNKFLCHPGSDQLMDDSDIPVKNKRLDGLIIEIMKENENAAFFLSKHYDVIKPFSDIDMNFHYARDVIKGRWPEAEEVIRKNPRVACGYAYDVIKGRWPEAEGVIKKDPEWAYWYARDIIKGRWSDGEEAIKKDLKSVYCYARDIIKGRWPEAEGVTKKDPEQAYAYARYITKGRWPEAEEVIKKDPKWAYYYARDMIKERWPEGEEAIKKDPQWAYYYAIDIVKERWPEGEEAIKKDPEWAYRHARDIVKERWPEGEKAIKKDPKWAYWYARDVIKGRWPEAEEAIKKDPGQAYWYARNVIKGRWPEA